MAKPTKFPEWARVPYDDPVKGGSNVIEPSEQKKDDGWARNEKPPASIQNWLHKITNDWLEYLDEHTGTQSITGDAKVTLNDSQTGWLLMNDETIGSATSGAFYASDDYEDLWKLIYSKVDDAWAPVTGGRTDVDNDWTLNKQMTLFKQLGRAIASAGAGLGLTVRALGEDDGVEKHALAAGEESDHEHHITYLGSPHTTPPNFVEAYCPGGVDYATAGADCGYTLPLPAKTDKTAAASPHENMQPTTFWNVLIKL